MVELRNRKKSASICTSRETAVREKRSVMSITHNGTQQMKIFARTKNRDLLILISSRVSFARLNDFCKREVNTKLCVSIFWKTLD